MNIDLELGRKLKYGIKRDELMAFHTSWLVGGPADYYMVPTDLVELQEIIFYCMEHKIPLYIFGNGSNLLVLDGGIRGAVVKIGEPFSYTRPVANGLVAGAGTPMSYLARSTAELGMQGLEFVIGIPGSLGGAVIMNAGAYGSYIGKYVREVKLVSLKGENLTVCRKDLSFAYRSSNLVGKGAIYEISLELEKGNPREAVSKMKKLLSERRLKHPDLPSAGSVFRNPTGKTAGQLIESAGGKGMRIGGAEVSTKHANFIVNTGGASASDILDLIKSVQELVREKHNIMLKPEVKIIGQES